MVNTHWNDLFCAVLQVFYISKKPISPSHRRVSKQCLAKRIKQIDDKGIISRFFACQHRRCAVVTTPIVIVNFVVRDLCITAIIWNAFYHQSIVKCCRSLTVIRPFVFPSGILGSWQYFEHNDRSRVRRCAWRAPQKRKVARRTATCCENKFSSATQKIWR